MPHIRPIRLESIDDLPIGNLVVDQPYHLPPISRVAFDNLRVRIKAHAQCRQPGMTLSTGQLASKTFSGWYVILRDRQKTNISGPGRPLGGISEALGKLELDESVTLDCGERHPQSARNTASQHGLRLGRKFKVSRDGTLFTFKRVA